jgi:[FeFe] hydrogenase H-cluster maturation GTPase HydF
LRGQYIETFKGTLLRVLPSEFSQKKPLLSDILPKYGVCIMIVPIDNEAPKGRIILPQVQAIRDALDSGAISMVVKETEYEIALGKLKDPPSLVICDSQVVKQMVEETPPEIPCTTFSILFSRYKGDLVEEVRGLVALKSLKKDDKILIAEACSHHPNEDDIGRVKIPNWLKDFLGFKPNISVSAGRDYPDTIKNYDLIIHCGGCMLTRNEKLVRIEKAKMAGVPITNYGIMISHIHGVLRRVLSPFPAALKEYNNILDK